MKQAPPLATQPTRKTAQRFLKRYRDFTAVRADGLPAVRVLGAFLGLLVVVGVLLIGFGINGTSSGAYHSAISSASDPNLLAGKPERIRSDEWNVAVPWTISQLQQGLPSINRAFPGGADADIPFGLPVHSAIMVLEPQQIGFLFLDVGRAYAWKWWVPGLALIGAAFMLMSTLLPRRPIVAAGLAIGFFFSPFLQWWYEPAADWPLVWGAVTLTAIIWALRSASHRPRILWAIAVAYLTATMAVGIYAPFIIPVVYVVLFAGIGLVIDARRTGTRWRSLVTRLLPTAVAGIVGAGIVTVWLRTKATVISAFLGTVYPGQRSNPTGVHDVLGFVRTISSSFSESLTLKAGFLGINSSEASTFFLLGVFLIPIGIWIAVARRRAGRTLPWLTIGLVGFLILTLAFQFIPGWDPLAHVLFLDLSNSTRMRIGVGFASFVLIGSIARDLDEQGLAGPRRLTWLTVAVFLVSQVAIAVAVGVVQGPGRLWTGSPAWLAYSVVSAAAIYLFARRMPLWGTAAFLAVTVASSIAVNPVYVGVFDLRPTAVARAIIATDSKHPRSWVGVGGSLENSLLLESGVTAYNGTQGAPSWKMWTEVDPSHTYVNQWNRLAGIVWTSASGEPKVTNSAADVINVTFDGCSQFAQKYVGHALSNKRIDSPCLVLKSHFRLRKSTEYLYDVVAPN